jgi:integrase
LLSVTCGSSFGGILRGLISENKVSVNRDLACLSKILSMVFDNELIDSNPMRRVRLLKESPSRERFITAEEEKRLFAQLTGRRDHIRSVVTIALNTGMRRGEILGLVGTRELFGSNDFHRRSKTGRTRTIPMNDIVFKELMTLRQDAGPREFVFSNSRTGVSFDSIKTGWRSACEDAGLVNLRFHDTRHTFATRLRANGVHEWDIRDLLGHASVRMTSVYTHQTPRICVTQLTRCPITSAAAYCINRQNRFAPRAHCGRDARAPSVRV